MGSGLMTGAAEQPPAAAGAAPVTGAALLLAAGDGADDGARAGLVEHAANASAKAAVASRTGAERYFIPVERKRWPTGANPPEVTALQRSAAPRFLAGSSGQN